MTNRHQNIECMIFDYQTTTNTDYKDNDIKPNEKTVHRGKGTSSKDVRPRVKYVHTMMDWTNTPASFDIMIERKQILRTNPHHRQAIYPGKPPDLELDKVRRTRPRLVMTPAISIDDVDDVEKRELLVKDKYTTQMMKEFKDCFDVSNVKATLRGTYAPTTPLALQKYTPPYISPEWRMKTTSWDQRQIRDYCDATKVFWLKTQNDALEMQ